MITDKVGNLITCIRNGLQRGKAFVVVQSSRFLCEIVSVLHKQGYILGYELRDLGNNKSEMEIRLKYCSVDKNNKGKKIPVIGRIVRVSTPGRRCYVSAKEINQPCGGLGVYVMSTSRGVLSGKEAKDSNIGGEVLFEVF